VQCGGVWDGALVLCVLEPSGSDGCANIQEFEARKYFIARERDDPSFSKTGWSFVATQHSLIPTSNLMQTETFTSSTIKGFAEVLRTRDSVQTRERYPLRSPDVTDGSMGKHRSPPVVESVSVRCWFRYSTEKMVFCHLNTRRFALNHAFHNATDFLPQAMRIVLPAVVSGVILCFCGSDCEGLKRSVRDDR